MTTRRLAALLLTAAALASPGSASAAVGVGHSGWYWGNPLPQGNTLRAVELNGARGYAAGEFGTLLRTEDAGASWTGIATGLTAELNRVGVIDADSLVVGGGCTLRRSDDAGATFKRLPFSASEARCSAPLAAFAFPSDRVGYLLLGDGTVLRTADGGTTFARRTAVPGSSSAGGSSTPSDIAFTGPDTGVAITRGGDGRAYRTTDGGGSWTLVATVPHGLNGLRFTDAANGFAVGEANTLVRTDDGGATWSARPLAGAPSSNLTGIRCTGSATCLIATQEGTRLLRTTDAGDTAASVTPSTSKIFAAALGSPTRAVAVGEGGATVVSDSAGMTFATIGESLPGTFRRLRAESPAIAYAAGGDGRAARTTDGGATWSPFAVSTADDVVDLSFPTQTTGFAVDSGGTALRTENGGTSWQILNTGANTRPAALLALDAKRVLLVGPRGLRRSVNGGASFAAVRSRAVRRAQLSDFDRAGGALFVHGEKALAISRNGGASWRRVRLPRRRTVADVDFSSARVGYLLTGPVCKGRLYVTRNGGRRWREITTLGTSAICELAFSDARNGWLGANIGEPAGNGVLRTTDGGRSWHPQLIARNGLDDLVATGRNTAVAVESSHLFGTATGGDQGTVSRLSLRSSKRRLRRPGRVKVGGRLRPPEGGERVVVAMRSGGRWTRKAVLVAANGTFTTTWRLRRSALFVAQWRGDDDRRGAGTGAVKVSVRRR